MSGEVRIVAIAVVVILVLCAVPIAQIIASTSNIRAKRHPERPRPRHWWQRWEVWCQIEHRGEVTGGKEVGWYPFRWMARTCARELEGSPDLLVASMDSLRDGVMLWPKFDVRRLEKP